MQYDQKKLKKSGFTLLELLAVLILIAVIALITVPVVTSSIKQARENAFKTGMINLLQAAENYYADHQSDITELIIFDFSNGGRNQFGEELAFQGTAPKNGRIIINEYGEITFVDVTNGKYYANYEDGDSDIVITDRGGTLTKDELTERLVKLESELKEMSDQIDSNTTIIEESKKSTDQLVTDSLEKAYPVGSIYISYSSTNPESLFGGTWVNYGRGKVFKGISSGSAGVTGGANTVTLSTDNLPSHTHSIPVLSGTALSAGAHTHTVSGTAASNGAHTHSITGTATSKTLTGKANFRSATTDHNSLLTGWTSGVMSGSTVTWSGTHARVYTIDESNPGRDRLSFSNTHSHTVTGTAASNGAHTHSVTGTAVSSGAHTHSVTMKAGTTGALGNATAVNVENAYITAYVWKRTA